MSDTINITVNETIDNIVVNPAITTDVIDINTYSTAETVNIDVTPEVTIVNINTVTGGGGTQTLAETLDLGNSTGGENIFINDADAIQLENTSLLKKGSYDFGGNGGISRVCSNQYEDMWQNGFRHVFDQSGFIRNSSNGFNVIPDSSFDVTLRFKVGSFWTLDDGTTYVCTDATEGDAVWEIYNSISNLVPYTGATEDVNIGDNDLYTNKVFLYDEVNDNYASIHYADGDFHIEDADGHKLLVIEDGFIQLHLTDIIQSNIFTTLLTETRDHYLPNNSGTLALTSDITGINSGTNTGDETVTTIKTKLGITTLSGSNTGDQDLSGLVVKNAAITGATKTKITYDSKGLVTSGADATTADIADTTNKRYVTDANLTTIGNQSGTNTGDETVTTIKSKLGITTLSGSNTGDETNATIISKLGYTPTRTFISAVDGATVANTTTITSTYTQLIPAGTFVAGDVVDLLYRVFTNVTAKASITGLYIYISTTNIAPGSAVSGATQLAIWNSTAGIRTAEMTRTIAVKGSTTRVPSAAVSASSDATLTGTATLLTIDWTVNQYFIFAIGHTVALSTETFSGDCYIIRKN
jgi:hypothetical protein